MNKYIVTVYTADKDNKPKTKSIVCNTDTEMFTAVQDCVTNDLAYEVNKAELTLVLSNLEKGEDKKK